jgi:hypothetical protein
MKNRNQYMTGALVLGLAAVAVMSAMNRQDIQNLQQAVIPAVEIIRFGEAADDVAKFDTATGALWRYNGDLHRPNVRGEWVLETPGVSSRVPGTYRLQQAAGATFMVDAATGETWILRRRGANAEWDMVREFR